MLEAGGDLDFGEEALRAERRGELRLEHLERDVAIVLEVVSEVDRRHAALAESARAVAVGKGGLQAGEDGVHPRQHTVQWLSWPIDRRASIAASWRASRAVCPRSTR